MLTRTTVYIESEDLKKLKKILIEKDEDFSKMLRKWISKYIEMNGGIYDETPTEPAKPIAPVLNKIAELRKLQEQVTKKQEPAPAQEYGFCPFCYIKKSKPVTLVTYLDQDQVKVEGKLCNECIVKAKTSGNTVTLGGLN